DQAKQQYLKTLKQYIPIVARVHGANHPELQKVRDIFDTIMQKDRDSGNKKPDLHEELLTLRETTHDYLIPQDACESFEAVYRMLAEIDEAYHQ
ncbi:MAG: hypothetical protein PHH86_10255, partial [Sphaerochaetaceae bacterium]|nr:hypothetical protein [Sphaerochaetaceae bacterium]